VGVVVSIAAWCFVEGTYQLQQAAGIVAAELPGMSLTPAVGVCMAAATVAVLGLPLASSLVVILLTANSGPGAMALVIVAAVVAQVFMHTIDARRRAFGDELDPVAAHEPRPARST
jgi:H+/Cl- antiporter ClcA